MRKPLSLPLPFLAALSSAIAFAIASPGCTTDYQKGLGDPNFGTPNSLANQTQPGPSSANAGTDGGSGSATTPECVRGGGALVDGGVCAVSFKNDILGVAFAGTANCQLPTCHGGTNPSAKPRIDATDAVAMWSEFATFKLSTGTPYINPCSIDPTKSSIAINVDSAAAVGRGTAMPSGQTGIPADQVAKINTWLTCGSPNN